NFLMNVDHGAILPSRNGLLGILGHDAGVTRDSFPMKRRLRQAALLLPRLAFIGEQAISEQPAAIPNNPVLHKILVMPNQDEIDQIRIIEKVDMDPSGAIVKEVAELFGPL